MPSLLAGSTQLTKTLWIGGACVTMTAGVVVPMRLGASMGEGDALPEIVLPADPARAKTQLALREVFRSLGMVVCAHESGGTDWVVCWTSDNDDRARVNANEIALVGFNRLMQTLELYSVESDEELELDSLLDESFIRTWRSRKDVHRRVLAHGLRDVALVWSDSAFPDGKLSVALTWDASASDVQSDPLGELVRSSFTVSLPGVQGTS
ncbi:MAG: hypothetical protein ACYTF7_01610 [Planctomycetota bacterium]|jgi:hypothetical protein